MTAVPLTDQQLRDRIAHALEREDSTNWGYDHGFSATYADCEETAAFVDAVLRVVQPELDRLRAELEQTLAQLAELKAEPLPVRWDRLVIHPKPGAPAPTIVCCLTDSGQPVALALDDELREALGLALVDPNPEN